MGDGSAAAADGDGRRVRRAGSKGDVGSASARNSGSHRSGVFGVVGTGKQRRKRDVFAIAAGLIGVVNVSAIIGGCKIPSVLVIEIGRTRGCSNAIVSTRSRVAAKNPEGFAGGVPGWDRHE